MKILTPAEVDEHRNHMLDEHRDGIPLQLVYTVQSREGTLRRLYNAVIGTPLEGEELRAAMRETEKALGGKAHTPEIDLGQPFIFQGTTYVLKTYYKPRSHVRVTPALELMADVAE